MDLFFTIIFWLSAGLISYTWILYPVVLYILNKINRYEDFSSPVFLMPDPPFVSLIIAVYNEEDVIARRIENLLGQDYPKNKMEVIIASDGSTDQTVDIARRYEPKGVKILEFKQNRGKAFVHNDAVKVAKGDVLVFSDAETVFEKGFLKNLIKHFSDPKVGCVIGRLVYQKEKDTALSSAESKYFKYEVWVRDKESRLGILIAATGAAMGCKKEIYEPLRGFEDVDVVIPLLSIVKGYKNVFESKAVAYDVPPSSAIQELRYRFRDTALSMAGTLRVMGQNLFNLSKRPSVLLSVISHRILRWLTPLLLLLLFISNAGLVHAGGMYNLTFVAQIMFYSFGVLGGIVEGFGRSIPLVSAIYSFLIANLGMMGGVLRFALGRASSSWKD